MNSALPSAAQVVIAALPNAAQVVIVALPNAAQVVIAALPNAGQCKYYIVTLYLAYWRSADNEGEDKRN